jgi:hypothetical protein
VGDQSDEAMVPGTRNIVIYVDESGLHRAPYYAFGSLWMPWERRGTLAAFVDRLRDRDKYYDEAKWSSVPRRPQFYEELVEEFFQRSWMMFHCLLVRKTDVDRSRHRGRENALQKHLTMLLDKKIGHFARLSAGATYRIRTDQLSVSYPKTDEVIEKILDADLKKLAVASRVHDVRQCDSRQTRGVQLVDVLLGAVTAAWQGDELVASKVELQRYIAGHLGWSSLRHDTHPGEVKFNVWHFHDPQAGGARVAQTKAVRLRIPMRFQRQSTVRTSVGAGR